MPNFRVNSSGSVREAIHYMFLPCDALHLNTDGAVADALVRGSVNGVPFVEFDPAAGAALAAGDGFGFALPVPYSYPVDGGATVHVRTFFGLTDGGGTEVATFQMLLESNLNDAATADPNDLTVQADEGGITMDAANSIHEVNFQVNVLGAVPGSLLGGEISLVSITNVAVNTEELRLFGGLEIIWRPVSLFE